MNIVRWNPAREMLKMQREMDNVMNSFFQSPTRQSENWGLALDVVENENDYTITAAVPGVKEEDLEITLENHVLTIKGETKFEEVTEGSRYHVQERRYGSFIRNLRLPQEIDAEGIEADYSDGIVTVRVPKTEAVQPKRIAVNRTNNEQVIEAE